MNLATSERIIKVHGEANKSEITELLFIVSLRLLRRFFVMTERASLACLYYRAAIKVCQDRHLRLLRLALQANEDEIVTAKSYSNILRKEDTCTITSKRAES